LEMSWCAHLLQALGAPAHEQHALARACDPPRLARGGRDDHSDQRAVQHRCGNVHSTLTPVLTTEHLPRQARDKQRETLKTRPVSAGRVSYTLHSEIESAKCVTANVSIVAHPTAAAAAVAAVGAASSSESDGGGAVLRLRTPGRLAIVSVHAGSSPGVALPASRWNVTDESVHFADGEVFIDSDRRSLCSLFLRPTIVCRDLPRQARDEHQGK